MGTSSRRVLLVTDNLNSGGVQRVVVNLANGLSARGHEIHVAAGEDGRLWTELAPRVTSHRLSSHSSPKVAFAWRVMELRRLIREVRPSVVHSHQRGVSLAARIARIGVNTATIEHVHNVFPPSLSKLMSFRSDLLLACGSEVERMLRVDYGRPAARVRLVPNGVSDPRERRALPTVGGESRVEKQRAYPCTVVTVARVSEQKQPRLWLEVMSSLCLDPNFSATWIGDGPLLERLRLDVEDRGLVEQIHLPGHSDEPFAEVEQASAVVMMSAWEGLPLALLEAAALGKPLVAIDVGSCRDVVKDAVNGHLIPPGTSPLEIADRVRDVVKASRRRSYGEASRLLYEREFTIDRFLDRVEDAYAQV